MEKHFHAMNLERWTRRQTYTYFTETVSTLIYSVTVPLDVTKLRKTLKDRGMKFFPVYLYLTARAMGEQKEFRMAMQDGVLGYWDFQTPFYPVLHDDDKTITFLWTEYEDDFKRFYENYTSDIAAYGNQHGILSAKGAPPSNNYIIACSPWFSFTGLSMQLQNAQNYYAPIFEAGGFSETGRSIRMPVSITVNHAVIDGYHIKVFLEHLQAMMDHPEEWMK